MQQDLSSSLVVVILTAWFCIVARIVVPVLARDVFAAYYDAKLTFLKKSLGDAYQQSPME